MSTLTSLISGGGGGGGASHLGVVLLTESTTVSFPVDVQALVYVIGAGGSGAASMYKKTCGGGAGGCAVSNLTLTSGTTYTATIGAGGAGVYQPVVNVVLNGVAGGNSSFSGSNITTMTGNGGLGGIGENDYGTALTGVAGGSASGGNIANVTGGSAGNVPVNTQRTSSGGDVGIFVTPPRAAGNISSYPTNVLGYNPLPFDLPFTGYANTAFISSPTYYYQTYSLAAGTKGTLAWEDITNRRRAISDSGAFSGGSGAAHVDSGSANNYALAGDASLGGGGGGAIAARQYAISGNGGVGAVIIQILSLG